MRTRKLLGLFLATLGLVLPAASLSVAVLYYNLGIGSGVVAAMGILFFVLGVEVLITDILEVWLSGGQAALVDGLQAG